MIDKLRRLLIRLIAWVLGLMWLGGLAVGAFLAASDGAYPFAILFAFMWLITALAALTAWDGAK